MILCSRRHLIYVALTFPAAVYLFLMFSAIGQMCFKTEFEQLDFKERYLKLVNTIQRKASSQLSSEVVENDAVDFRKLLHTGDSGVMSYSLHSISAFSVHENEHPYLNSVNSHSYPTRPSLIHNCSSISHMKIRSKIGHGVSKQAYIAEYKGSQVAIKMVTRHIHEVRSCLERLKQTKMKELQTKDKDQAVEMSSVISEKIPKFKTEKLGFLSDRHFSQSNEISNPNTSKYSSSERQFAMVQPLQLEISAHERQRCYTFPTARLMKEILLSEQLQHHNLARLLGYCVRSEESDSTDISEHGVISVYELGSRFVLDNLQILPWQVRLRHAIEMADLLVYLQHSPLGSLVVPDFKEGHLVMVNGSLKLIDLDDVNNLEPECLVLSGHQTPCPYNLRCVRALCEGFNAKENLKNMNKLVFKRLLFPLTFPESVVTRIGQINANLDSLTISAEELRAILFDIQAFLGKHEPA